MKVSKDQNTVTMTAVFVEDGECDDCCMCAILEGDCIAPDNGNGLCIGRDDGKEGNFKEVTPCK